MALAAVLISEADLLILDEPTNHMDMRSKDILKNAIMKYDGTVIVVSHDREFLDGMVSKVYEFRNGGVREYLGGIYYFLEKRKLESLQEVERKDAPAKEAAPKASSSGKLTYEQKKSRKNSCASSARRSKRSKHRWPIWRRRSRITTVNSPKRPNTTKPTTRLTTS